MLSPPKSADHTSLETFSTLGDFCTALNFDVRKKRTKLPELGSWGGGGFRKFGQCPKENVFLPLTPSLRHTIQHSVKCGVVGTLEVYDRVSKCSGKYERLLAERYKLWLLVNVTI